MKIDSYAKDLAAATTPENLIADSGNQWRHAREVVITCPAANTSDLTIGSRERQDFVVAKGTSLRLSFINRTGQAGNYELANIWVKAGTNADDVQILLIDPSN